MNKLISLTICLGLQISLFVQGQSIDPSSEWRVYFTKVSIGEDWYRVINNYKDFIDGDTILNSREYYKIYRSGYIDTLPISPRYQPIYHSYEHYFHGFLREENNKWFMYYDNQDRLIYDFTLETGDTIESFFDYDCGHIIIEDVDSVIIDGDLKKRFYLSDIGVGAEYIIEGIGASTGLFEFFCTFESGSFLVCYARNGISIWGDSTEECDLTVFINENQGNVFPISIFPNPTADFSLLSIPSGLEKVSFKLVDLTGRIVYQDSFESPSINKIQLSSYHSGIYIGIIETKGLSQTVKLIIE